MNCKAVLYDTIARDKRLDVTGETMAAALLAMGWTERREGVFGVGEDVEETDGLDEV